MKIAIACDHAGFPLKDAILEVVLAAGHEPIDLGAFEFVPGDDYPDYAKKLGEAIQTGKAQRGVLVCGSGVGASIAANKMKGVYAAVCHDIYSAHQGVEHDEMNVLCLGARILGEAPAREIVAAFLDAQFSNQARHQRRVGKVREMEKNE